MASPGELIWIDIDDRAAAAIRGYHRSGREDEASLAGQAALSIYLTGGIQHWIDARMGGRPKSPSKIRASVKGMACGNKRTPVDTYTLSLPTPRVKPDTAYVLAIDVSAGTHTSRRVCLVGWSFGNGLKVSRRRGQESNLRGFELRPMKRLKEIRDG